MAGTRRVAVRSFGSEVPEPAVRDLAEWVKRRRGIAGDLTSYYLEESLNAQEGVDLTCPGGRIYRDRILETFRGLDDGTLVREPSADTALVEEDARWGSSIRKGLAFSVPAPHLLGIRDGYYQDREEFCEGLSACYRQILRAMRDAGAAHHVLLGDRLYEDEVERLAGPRSFFFYPGLTAEDLPVLLEYQDTAAVHPALLSRALELLDEFDLRHLFIVGGAAEDLLAAGEHLDPDQVSLGGYCTENCREYWKGLVERAVIHR